VEYPSFEIDVMLFVEYAEMLTEKLKSPDNSGRLKVATRSTSLDRIQERINNVIGFYVYSFGSLIQFFRSKATDLTLERCPDCGDRALAFESGCMTCKSCGYSRCD